MATGDGLLARLAPVGRRLSPPQLARIAALAAEHGNGLVEVTARGNLQIRGLTADSADPFAEEIEAVVDIQTGHNIDISPLAGLDPAEISDPRVVERAIRRLAAERGLAGRLAPKVSVVIDGSGSIGLGQLAADIRLTAEGQHWQIAIADRVVGTVPQDRAADHVVAVLEAIAGLGPEARGRDLGLAGPAMAPRGDEARFAYPLADGLTGLRIGLPFGSADSVQLEALAALPGIIAFLPAPGHALIALVSSVDAETIHKRIAALGFVAGADARNHIAACIGSAGCASGQFPARAIAAGLATAHPAFFDGSFTLHVSGCAKGCALPRKALLVLVGDGGDCRLVFDDRAGSGALLSFSRDGIEPAIARLETLWRDNRTLGESVAACFTRLGAARLVAALRQG